MPITICLMSRSTMIKILDIGNVYTHIQNYKLWFSLLLMPTLHHEWKNRLFFQEISHKIQHVLI